MSNITFNRTTMIRKVKNDDVTQICDIYNYYIKNTIITFEQEPVSEDEMGNRIKENSAFFPWIVFEENNELLGYSYAAKWKIRHAYRFSTESTIYLKDDIVGKGIGTLLYAELINILREKGIHAIFGGIALPNEKSRKLHEKLGFRKVAHLEEVGYKFDKWIDVGYWELILK